MLNNPEKYKKKEQQNSYQGGYQNPYGNQGWSNRGYTGQYGNSGGSYGGYGSFGGFDFDDLFGFSGRGNEPIRPQARADDSPAIRNAINLMNHGRYNDANQILNNIVSAERNGRWYYLSALINKGMGNSIQAAEQIDRAIKLEPQNPDYARARQQIHRAGAAYDEAGRGFEKAAENMGRAFMGFCATQFFCMFCCHP